VCQLLPDAAIDQDAPAPALSMQPALPAQAPTGRRRSAARAQALNG
jgi:hypothetical protein